MSEEKKVAETLVTSENIAEFTAQKLGLVDNEPVKTEAEVGEAEEASHSEPESEQDQSGRDEKGNDATTTEDFKEKKPNPKLEKRLSKLVKERETLREEAIRERDAREKLEARIRELESRSNPSSNQMDDLGQEPEPEQFGDSYQYGKAVAEYAAKKALADRDKEQLSRQAQEQQQLKIKSWADRVNAAKKEMPDFDAMVESSDVSVNEHVKEAIMDSENGPKILYYLAENQDFAKKLSAMSPVSAVREIGKIEARFEKSDKSNSSKTPVVEKSKAPAPISPLRGTAAISGSSVDSEGKFSGKYQQWKAARQAGKIR